ncbi:MAG: hypothetical protein ACJ76D_09360, partial [Solirubrobacterales bacterium]
KHAPTMQEKRRALDRNLLRVGVACGVLVGLAVAIATYEWNPGSCQIGSCIGDVLAKTLLPAVAKTAAGGLAGLGVGALTVVLIRVGRQS